MTVTLSRALRNNLDVLVTTGAWRYPQSVAIIRSAQDTLVELGLAEHRKVNEDGAWVDYIVATVAGREHSRGFTAPSVHDIFDHRIARRLDSGRRSMPAKMIYKDEHGRQQVTSDRLVSATLQVNLAAQSIAGREPRVKMRMASGEVTIDAPFRSADAPWFWLAHMADATGCRATVKMRVLWLYSKGFPPPERFRTALPWEPSPSG